MHTNLDTVGTDLLEVTVITGPYVNTTLMELSHLR